MPNEGIQRQNGAGDGAIVSCKELSRRFGEGEAAVDALRGVSLDFPQGELTAIVGPSGSGKSTLMHLLAGLDKPTGGSAWIDGVEVTALDDKGLTSLRREKLGFIFQFFNLVPVLDAAENIELPLKIAGRDVDPAWRDRLLDTVGLADRGDPSPVGALRRAAAAGRDRPCADRPSGRRLRRRADRQPRLDVGQRGPRPAAHLGRRFRPDRRRGHPRSEGRGLRRPRHRPRRRPGRRRSEGGGRGRRHRPDAGHSRCSASRFAGWLPGSSARP